MAPFPWDSDFDLKLYSGVPREHDAVDVVDAEQRLTKAQFLADARAMLACNNGTAEIF